MRLGCLLQTSCAPTQSQPRVVPLECPDLPELSPPIKRPTIKAIDLNLEANGRDGVRWEGAEEGGGFIGCEVVEGVYCVEAHAGDVEEGGDYVDSQAPAWRGVRTCDE